MGRPLLTRAIEERGGTIANMQSVVKVLCRGTVAKGHSRRELARYSWSDEEDVWLRTDEEDTEWVHIAHRRTADGGIQFYPRPVFECPCGNRPVYTHEELQAQIAQAASQGKHLTV